MFRILMPLPDYDFDPTEASIPWRACHDRGWKVDFCTEYGNIAHTDQNRLNGPLPGLLSPSAKARQAYQLMIKDPSFQAPIPFADVEPERYDALLLPGGDGLRMRQYLESEQLRGKVLQIWQQSKLVGAICHGILVLARTIKPDTNRSVLYGYKVAVLPKSLDRFAYLADKWFIRHGYLMYANCVADEVKASLQSSADITSGPGILSPYVLVYKNLVTSRWYMDADVFARKFTSELEQRQKHGE